MIKLYIHHPYSESFFLRLFHNTTNRKVTNLNDIVIIECEYNNKIFHIEYSEELHNKPDGYHILDTVYNWTYESLNSDYGDELPLIQEFIHNLKGKKNWVINIFRTEKLLGKYDTYYPTPSVLRPKPVWLEELLSELNEHRIVSDNCFINNSILSAYPNHFFAFTNTIFRWNEMISIRWFYEFKPVFSRLSFNYDLMYSVRNHRKYRIDILDGLSKINNERLLLQRTDSVENSNFEKYGDTNIENVRLNSIKGNSDFSNLKWIENNHGINWDIFFRMLSMSKMQILDESWSFQSKEFNSQYLSEKTIGLVLAGIPFISTHHYPLTILEKSLGIEPHPFMEDFKKHSGKTNLFVEFVEKFLTNFNENYEKCKIWTDICAKLMVEKIESENSYLDLIINNFNVDIKKTSKLI